MREASKYYLLAYSYFSLTPESHRNMFTPFQPAQELGPFRGLAIEVIISLHMYFVILAVTDTKRGTVCNMPGLPAGCSVAVGIMAAVRHLMLNVTTFVKPPNQQGCYPAI